MSNNKQQQKNMIFNVSNEILNENDMMNDNEFCDAKESEIAF